MEDTSKIKKSDARVNNSNSAEGVAGRQDIVLPEYVDQNESNTVDNTVIAGDNKIAENVADFISVEEKAVDKRLKELEAILPAFDMEACNGIPVVYSLAQKFGHNDPYLRSMLILGTLATCSSVMGNVFFTREGKKFYPNLGVIVAAPPASGKGELEVCRELVSEIDRKLSSQFESERNDWEKMSGNDKSTPEMTALVFPEDCTAAAFNKMLADNNGNGLMFTTELKSLLKMLNNSDYGITRQSLLKALWNEEISFARKSDVTLTKIPDSKLAIVSSGVSEDILSFLGVDGVGSGLLSRMIFFSLMTPRREWHSWNIDDDNDCSTILGEEKQIVENIYNTLSLRTSPLRVKFVSSEFDMINEAYAQRYVSAEETNILGPYWDSVLKRMPVIMCRIAMILTVLNHANDLVELREADHVTVPEWIFGESFEISEALIEHTKFFYLLAIKNGQRSRENEILQRLAKAVTASDATKRKKLIMLLEANGKFKREDFYLFAKEVGYKSLTSIRRVFRTMETCSDIVLCPTQSNEGGKLYQLNRAPLSRIFSIVKQQKKTIKM